MAANDIDPIEKKSFGKWFFAIAGLAFLVTNWMFYDEVVMRRTWKDYAVGFNKLEAGKLEADLDKVKKAFAANEEAKEKKFQAQALKDEPAFLKTITPELEKDLSLRQIKLLQEQSEIAQDGPEYQAAKKELARKLIVLSDAKQDFGFTKADQDEVFYEWKHHLAQEIHLPQEQQIGANAYKEEYYHLEKRLAEYKANVDAAQKSYDETQNLLNKFDDEVKRWKSAEKKLLEPITKLEKKIEAVKTRGDEIKQVVNNDLGRGGVVDWGMVDRCESCHLAINRDGFEKEKQPYATHPHRAEIFGKHPIETYGCTTCHGGQGRATQIKHHPLEEGDFVHGFEHHWKEPLLRKEMVESSCSKCHLDQWKLDYAPVGMAGKKLFWDLGCVGCHNIKGFEAAPKVGPSLLKVKNKVNEEWLLAWIKNPKAYLPHTKMPTPPLDIEAPAQSEKVAAYILQTSQEFPLPYGAYPGGNAEAGQKTFETIGCIGCHSIGAKGGEAGPALDRIAEKTTADWIYNWIQNPKLYNPHTRMPSLRLSGEEAANITAYLSQLGKSLDQNQELRARLADADAAKQGFKLISEYGCYGCHEIKGFESTSKLSVDLTSFGRKDVHELDFGDSTIPRTWEDWTAGKIKDPRMYLTERTSNRMPTFGLSDKDIHSLLVFLKGMKKEPVPSTYIQSNVVPNQKNIDDGRRLTERLNCKSCHTIEGEGGGIAATVGEEQAPPILTGIGARVRPEWMFSFLKNPAAMPVRNWLETRMPTFGFTDDENNQIIAYFDALNRKNPHFSSLPTKDFDPEMLAAGEKLASAEYFNCFSCHVKNGQLPSMPPISWAPDLYRAPQRIRYDFIPEWIKDPQVFTPGVKMPGFLPTPDSGVPDILGGDREKQSQAVRDYIMSLGLSKSSGSVDSSTNSVPKTN